MRPLSLFACFLLFTIISIQSNAQGWAWAAGGTGGSEGWAVCTDPWGNVFGAGFNYNANTYLGTTTLTGFGTRAAIVVKYDASGNLVWAHSTQNSNAGPIGITADVHGNLYLLGYYSDTTVTITPYLLTQLGGLKEYFLAKYDPAGNVVWAKNIASANTSIFTYFFQNGGIATDGSDIFITFTFAGTTIQLGASSYTNSDPSGITTDFIVAKVDPSGNIAWAKKIGGDKDDAVAGIAVSSARNIYLAGTFRSSSLLFDGSTLYSTGNGSIFLAKLDETGNSLWAKSAGGNGEQVGGIATDAGESAFIVGTFGYAYPPVNFTIGSSSLTVSPLGSSVFLAKYNSVGNVDWAKEISSDNTSIDGYGVAADACQNIWISGSMGDYGTVTSMLNIDGHSLSVPPGSNDPMFLAGYTTSGSYITSVALPTGGDDLNGICTDGIGNVFIGGDYAVSPFTLGNTTLIDTTYEENIFVAKYTINNIIDTGKVQINNICMLDSIMLYAPSGFLYCLWNDGSVGSEHKVNTIGQYWVQCTGGCGKPVEIDTFHVIHGPVDLSFSLGNDTTICGALELQAPVKGGTYIWQDGTTESTDEATKAGTYFVTVHDDGCSYTDSIRLTEGLCTDCMLLIPNAFTPNNDGKNDFFYPIISPGCQVTNYFFAIYNRWGQQVFITHDPNAKWDGKFMETLAEVDVYMYYLKYTSGIDNTPHMKKGDVTLIR